MKCLALCQVLGIARHISQSLPGVGEQRAGFVLKAQIKRERGFSTWSDSATF